MGGDFGPSVVVPAAVDALAAYPRLQLILVGKRDAIEKELTQYGSQKGRERLEVQEASQVIEMDEAPALALRQKKDASMRVAIDLVKKGRAQACVSAGNTGALMAIARFVLKMVQGVDRPAIVYSIPSLAGHVHMLDLGANVDCEPKHLLEFAVMGSVLAQEMDDNPTPRVALLNIGVEEIKGSELVKQAARLISQAPALNYTGFVEGDDIFKGKADVVVCDGFVGNVALKASEGLAWLMLKLVKEAFKGSLYGRMAALIAAPVLRSLQRRFDPGHYNGASFLGLQGTVIKSHGSADRKAFVAAIRVAMVEAEKQVPEKIHARVSEQLGQSRTA